jgi:hypothetical protein
VAVFFFATAFFATAFFATAFFAIAFFLAAFFAGFPRASIATSTRTDFSSFGYEGGWQVIEVIPFAASASAKASTPR